MTASLKIPSPNTIEYSLGNFRDEIAYSDAPVSILQKHAERSRISQIESVLILVTSFASLIRSRIFEKQLLSWLASNSNRATITKKIKVPKTPNMVIYDKFFRNDCFLRLNPAANIIGG